MRFVPPYTPMSKASKRSFSTPDLTNPGKVIPPTAHWVDGSDPFYAGLDEQPQGNPTNGSWWMVQILSTRASTNSRKGIHQRELVDGSDPF